MVTCVRCGGEVGEKWGRCGGDVRAMVTCVKPASLFSSRWRRSALSKRLCSFACCARRPGTMLPRMQRPRAPLSCLSRPSSLGCATVCDCRPGLTSSSTCGHHVCAACAWRVHGVWMACACACAYACAYACACAYAWQQHLWPPVFDVLLPIELLELLQRLARLLVAHALEAVPPLCLHLTQLDVQVERHHHDDRGQRKVPGLG